MEKQRAYITGIKHCVQYDTWEEFIQNEQGLRRIWNDFSLFSWNLHPSHKQILQLVWISNDQFNGDLPTTSPIKRLQSYLEIRQVEIKFSFEEQNKIQSWLTLNTPSFWPNPALFAPVA